MDMKNHKDQEVDDQPYEGPPDDVKRAVDGVQDDLEGDDDDTA